MTVIITCEGNALRPEAVELADKIQKGKKSSQDVVLHDLEGVRHDEAYGLALKLLKQALND